MYRVGNKGIVIKELEKRIADPPTDLTIQML